MSTVSVRYIVDDLDAAIGFYRDDLGFEVVMHPAPTFAMLSRGDLRLVLSAPGGGPGRGHPLSLRVDLGSGNYRGSRTGRRHG